MALLATTLLQGPEPSPGVRPSGWMLVRRNLLVYRKSWLVFLTGFLEPVFYLFSIGIGVGAMINGFEVNGQVVEYAAFVAPGMLAASAMNGAILDATYGIFFKLRYDKLYESVLATPMRTFDIASGEMTWSLLRSGVYAAGFLVVMAVMGLTGSWWAVLALPASLLTGFAFAGAGMALTTFMRSWQDFEYIQLSIVPMFLFSATFFPLSTYPDVLQWLVRCTPLYHGVALERALLLGDMGWGVLWHVLYLLVLGLLGVLGAARRLERLLLS
jgi:lipooligosaccharide transport system permease protein